MRPWTSVALLAVVLIKWISGIHGRQYIDSRHDYCVQPENFKICDILREHNYDVRKRFLRFGRNFGDPMLRFGRGGTKDDDNEAKRLDAFEDKGFLRFGRSSYDDSLASIFNRVPNYKGWPYRRKRYADTEDKPQTEEGTNGAENNPTNSVESDKRSQQNVDTRFDDLQFLRFGRNGWLHFGKREDS